MKSKSRPIDDPEYVQGQILALQALLLGLAQQLPREDFRATSLQRLEVLRTTLLGEAVADSTLQAVDECEAWVRRVTE